MRRFLSFVVTFLCLFTSVLAYGCNTSQLIQNGYYIPSSGIAENVYVLYEEEGNPKDPFCWEIKGNTAKCWTSGMTVYKADILEKDGRIYFQGYKFKEGILSSIELGSEEIYEVIYNEIEKRITVIKE